MVQVEKASLMGGNTCILSGCVESGGSATDGWVAINGEVLPFVGGVTQPYVIIVETATQKEFFGGEMHDYYLDRVATFGTADEQFAWADFKRNDPSNGVLARFDTIERMLKPLMGYDVSGTTYYGSWLFWGRPAGEIPDGWEAVPDAEWKGKIPVVMDDTDVDFDVVGEMGGSKTISIGQTNLPNVQLDVVIPSSKTSTTDSGGGSSLTNKITTGADTDEVGGVTGIKTSALGSGTALKHLLPYKVVMFIRFVG